MKYQTTAAYVTGGICGDLWMPQCPAGKYYRANLRGPWGIMERFTEPVSFKDALHSVLLEEGGDFQYAKFTADTIICVERRMQDTAGYKVHVWEREVSLFCPDLVDAEVFTGDWESFYD